MNTTFPEPVTPTQTSGVSVPDAKASLIVPIMTTQKVDDILDAAQRLRENLLFEEYLKSIEEYRRQHNTIPDSD